MEKILIQRIYVLFMTVSYSTASDSTNKWVLDHDFENNLDTSQLLWDKNGISLLTCGSLCNMNPSCKSFFYHPSLNKCLGSQSYKRGLPLGQSMQQGWNYYTKTQQCDGDYKFNKSLSLCFKIHPEMKTFSDAMDACEAEGAKLIIIRNAMELLQVQNAIKATESSRDTFTKEFIEHAIKSGETQVAGQISWPFIGLRKAISNGIAMWKWWNGQIASYLDWEPGEPNDFYGNEDCGNIFQGWNYKFDDSNCLSRNSFICQRNF